MKKQKNILLCIVILISITGCWSRQEPKTLAIVDSIIYDITDDNKYQLIIEIMNPTAISGGIKETGSGDKNPYITVISEGVSAPEALRNATESLERVIFAAHNQVRFFSEKLAKKNINSIMDYILRDQMTSENPMIVVIKDKDPKQIYKSSIGLSTKVGDYINSLSTTQPKETSKSVFVSTLDFIKDHYREGKQPVAGVVELVKSEAIPSKNTLTSSKDFKGSSSKNLEIKYKGLAAFKNNKLVGYMNENETRAYNFVTDNIKNAYITVPSGKDVTVFTICNTKSKIKTTMKNGKVNIDVNIKTGTQIIQESSQIDITKAKPLKKMEKIFGKHMEKEIMNAIKKAQLEFKSDIFGFGINMHIQNPKIWKKIKKDWDDYFSKAKVNVTVSTIVDRSGEIKEPFEMENLK